MFVLTHVVMEFDFLPDIARFSSWYRLIRATVRVLEAVDRWQWRLKFKSDLDRQIYAENFWLRKIQCDSFNKEWLSIKNSRPLSRESRIISLNPFIDEQGLLRVGGRVNYFPDTGKAFQPIILSSNHPAVRLLISHFHEKFFHKNHEAVVNELKQRYWILGIRKCLRSIVNKCAFCRILRGLPFSPKMGNLPKARLGYGLRPFYYCGVDYFGPMMIKIGRRREKRWGVLFTCMTTRAVWIETAHSLSADSAIMAVQRLAARRAWPGVMYSDNGTNFRGASEELREALRVMDRERLKSFATKNNIEWKFDSPTANNIIWRFNPPTAAHMGGVWERMIRSVKECLNFTLKNHVPSDEVLRTFLAEVEHSVNSRPLTHVSLDPDSQEALTPNHFLFGTSSGTVRLRQYEAGEKCLKKQWHQAQHLADAFWHRWLREYFPTLLPRKKWFVSDDLIHVGDLVLVIDNNVPRNEWRKGVITRVFPADENGEIHRVEVRTASGVLDRPVRKLVRFSSVQNN